MYGGTIFFTNDKQECLWNIFNFTSILTTKPALTLLLFWTNNMMSGKSNVQVSLMAGERHYHYLWLTYSNVLCAESDGFAYLWLARDFFLPVRILANMSLEQEGRRYIWNNCVLYIPVRNMYLMHLVCTGSLYMVILIANLPDAIISGKQMANYVPFTPAVQMSCIHLL